MDWFHQNSKICGVFLARFIKTSPLDARVPDEFSTVSLEALKNGVHLDRRDYPVAVAFSFCVVSAILRQKCPKPDEKTCTAGWLASHD